MIIKITKYKCFTQNIRRYILINSFTLLDKFISSKKKYTKGLSFCENFIWSKRILMISFQDSRFNISWNISGLSFVTLKFCMTTIIINIQYLLLNFNIYTVGKEMCVEFFINANCANILFYSYNLDITPLVNCLNFKSICS